MAEERTLGVDSQADREKVVSEVKNVLLRDEHFRHLPAFARDYLLNQLGVLAMGFHGSPMQLEAYLRNAVEQIMGVALAMQARNEDEEKIKAKLNEKWQQGWDIPNLTPEQQKHFNGLLHNISLHEQTWQETRHMVKALDELGKERDVWSEDEARNMARQDPEAFRDHLIDLKAEIALRTVFLNQGRKSLKSAESDALSAARMLGIVAEDFDELRKKFQEMPATHLTEEVQQVRAKVDACVAQRKELHSQEVKVKCRQMEERRVVRVGKEEGVRLDTLPEVQERIESHVNTKLAHVVEINDTQQVINDAREAAAKLEEQMQQQEMLQKLEKIEAAQMDDRVKNLELEGLCDIIRDKFPDLPPGASPQEFLATIKANPSLQADEEIAFVYEELKATFPEEKERSQLQGQTLTEKQQKTDINTPAIDGKDRLSLEDVTRTLQKSFGTQTANKPSASPISFRDRLEQRSNEPDNNGRGR